MSYSEDLFVANACSSDSFFDFTQKVLEIFPHEPAFGGLTAKAIIQQAGTSGVTFHGTKVNENIARALQYVAPFVQDSRVQIAFKAFENLSLALNDHTKFSMFMHAATKHFGKGTEAAFGACIQFLAALRSGLLYKDIVKDSHVTKDFWVDTRSKVGFACVFQALRIH